LKSLYESEAEQKELEIRQIKEKNLKFDLFDKKVSQNQA